MHNSNFTTAELEVFLNRCVEKYNSPDFIKLDPISIPHRFTKRQDIEIAGLFAALISWGNRTSIINSCHRLMDIMDNAPYKFIMECDLEKKNQKIKEITRFVHRTFNGFDLLHLFRFLQHHYKIRKEHSLESAFSIGLKKSDRNIENGLANFHRYVFEFDEAAGIEMHCRKHLATPEKKSACKKLNMYLRWMCRQDDRGVDFGLWTSIRPHQLVIPMDVHVARVAEKLGLLTRKQHDWQAATTLTEVLKVFDAMDPVKYDFALFGLGVMEKY